MRKRYEEKNPPPPPAILEAPTAETHRRDTRRMAFLIALLRVFRENSVGVIYRSRLEESFRFFLYLLDLRGVGRDLGFKWNITTHESVELWNLIHEVEEMRFLLGRGLSKDFDFPRDFDKYTEWYLAQLEAREHEAIGYAGPMACRSYQLSEKYEVAVRRHQENAERAAQI